MLREIKTLIAKPLRNERGMALIIALAAVSLIFYLVTETTYETVIEYKLSSSMVNDLKAHYAARAGIEMSLLRLQIYKKAVHQFGKTLGPNSSVLNQIWQMPFVWPPVIPNEAQRIDREAIKEIVKESLMKSSYITTITDGGSKIDLSDLDSPSKTLKQSIHRQLLNVLYNKIDNDPDWSDNNSFDPEQIVDNIQDWVDKDEQTTDGGSESSLYTDYKEGQWPPNRTFRTIEELRLVSGVTENIYQLLAPQVTIYGFKGINVNLVAKEVFQSFSSEITDELAEQIVEYRDDPQLHGPFKSEKDFLQFMSEQIGVTLNQKDDSKIPIVVDAVHNFIIKSTASFANSTKEITAVTYNMSKVRKRLQHFVDKEKTPTAADGASARKTGKGTSDKRGLPPKGRPRVVFWLEK